jgi:hypothetical protein
MCFPQSLQVWHAVRQHLAWIRAMHNTAVYSSSRSSSGSTSSSDASSSDTSSDAATTAAASWAVRHRTEVLTQRAAKFNSWQASHMCKNFKYMNMQSTLFSSFVTALVVLQVTLLRGQHACTLLLAVLCNTTN